MNIKSYWLSVFLLLIIVLKCSSVFSAGERVVITFSTYSGNQEDSDQFRTSLDRTKNLLIQNIIDETKSTEYLKNLRIAETKKSFHL